MGELFQNWICLLLFRIALPLTFLIVTVLRFNLFSFVYGCLMLVAPLLQRPTPKSLSGHTGRYLITCVVLCSVTLLSQIVFQIYINTRSHAIGNCSETETLLRHIGLQKVSSNMLSNASIIVPDVAAFVISLVVLICCHALLRKRRSHDDRTPLFSSKFWSAKSCATVFDYVAKFFTLVFMSLAGILRPSAIASVYFLSVLVSVTVWSVFVRLHQCWFQRLRLFLLVYSALHLAAIYLVQFEYFHSLWTAHVQQNGTFERLFGLTHFVDMNCMNDTVVAVREDLPWTLYISVFMVVAFYFVLAWELRRCRRKGFMIRKLKGSKPDDSSVGHKLDPELATNQDTEQNLCNEPMVSFNTKGRDSPDFGSVVIGMDTEPEQMHNRSVISSVRLYLMKQSYIGTLIIMMAWSIAYHSWLTFIFLLGACFIWILPQKSVVCLRCSPVIVFYAICLLILQYIYSFNLSNEELPITTENGYKFHEIGLVKEDNPAIPVGIKLGFTCMFWLTLRQFILQRQKSKTPTNRIRLQTMVDGHQQFYKNESQDGETIVVVGRWLWHKLCKYWILACAALFLLISLQEAVIFRIIYMALFLCFVFTFQISYRFWRLCMKAFWWLVILYSMVVLGCIYTYQFDGFPALWQNNTGMSEQMISDLGLRKFDTKMLFVQLLTPTSFLIVIIMQLHYFQETFLVISDLDRFQKKEEEQQGASEDVDPSIHIGDLSIDNDDVTRRCLKVRLLAILHYISKKVLDFADAVSSVLWRFLEIHIFKFVVIAIFLCCVLQVNVLNTVLVLVVVILLPFEKMHRTMSVFCLLWSSAVLLLKMVYQLESVPNNLMTSNCTSSQLLSSMPGSDLQTNDSMNMSYPDYMNTSDPDYNISSPYNKIIDSSEYFGLKKESHLASYLLIYIVMVLILAMEAVVKYHQEQYYRHPDRSRPMNGIMFNDIRWTDADSGVKECSMFFANYAFYKFGKELCFMMTMITMVIRLDVFSVVYGLFLGLLLLLRRRSCHAIWPIYVIILIILLLLQYLSCRGMPPALCLEYPWTYWAAPINLKTYLFLLDTHSQRSYKLIADFFQLLLACLQWEVFYLETTKKNEFGGGSNYSVIRDVEERKPNPHANDFTSYKNSYLDYLKMVVFFWSFWLTLMIVLICGMSRISLFCMGYLIGCFVFLWFGEGMLLKPIRKLVRMWMGLLFYCYIVVLAKCCLQLVGCVYAMDIISQPFCWIAALLNIVCLQSTYYKQPEKMPCPISQDEAGLSWDAVCFVFLLFMVRVFKTWYFQHVVMELNVRNSLAARGAELINQSLVEEVERLKQQEEDVVVKIKQKMERIKDRHRKCLQKKTKASEESNDHYFVIRSGDYYMFEDMTDDEEEIEMIDYGLDKRMAPEMLIDETVLETPDWRARKPSVGPIAIINAAIQGGTKEALYLAGGRNSKFSMQTSRRSSSAREYATPDPDLPPSSPQFSHSPEMFYSDKDISASNPVLMTKKAEVDSAIYTEQSTDVQEFHGSRQSPKRPGMMSPSEAITPVAEEVLSDGDDDVFDGKEQKEKPDGENQGTVTRGCSFAIVFIDSILDSLTAFLYRLSSKYRSISRSLEAEKQQEKLRRKSAGSSLRHRSSEGEPCDEPDYTTGSRRPSNVVLRQRENQKRDEENITKLKTAERDFHTRMPRPLRLLIAILEAMMSRTDLLCYFAMVLNVLLSASILSIMFPLSIFFWGMLSIPRPTKTYWIAMITYTEAIIVVKYLFQFSFFPWHPPPNPPPVFWLPRVIGIEKQDMYAALDFFLLFCLFLHRMVLKSHGLWKNAKALNADLKRCSISASPVSSPMRHSGTGKAESTKEGNITLKSQKPPVEGVTMDVIGSTTIGEGTEAQMPPELMEPSEETDEPNRCKACCMKLFRPVYEFFSRMINPEFSAVSDVYAFMFACDLVTFLIVVFGYSSFGPESVEDADVATVLQQSKVPVPFLAMLLVQFVLIIIDRALYLRKLVFGKFLFHIFLVILVHIWMFFLLPAISDRAFTDNVAAQLWYFFKCIYFALSCYQIRSGYPTRILGNFLTKNFNYVNLFCFKGFLAVPFLLELRALMDWMWTDTTLALSSWLQMEDIYANIFVLKCWRRAEARYPTPSGERRSVIVKYGVGGLILVVLVFIIWFPLLLFSLSGSIFNPNPPVVVDLEMRISSYQSIFSMTAQSQDIEMITGEWYDELKKLYKDDQLAQGYLMNYREEDVYIAKIRGTSASTWEISLPSEKHLYDMLTSTDKVTFTTVISVRREPKSNSISVQTVVGSFETTLNGSNPKEKKMMETLANMINGTDNLDVTIPEVFPRYMTFPSQRRINESYALNRNLNRSSVRLSLHQHPVRKTRWWQVEEYINSSMLVHENLGELVDEDNQSPRFNPFLTIVTFNERIPTGVFTVLNNYGIIGIYVSVVLVLGKFVRLWTQGLMMRIMFEELPNPDPVWMLCNNIYLARSTQDYKLEEELVAKLIFIFRSPELLVKITKAKEIKRKRKRE